MVMLQTIIHIAAFILLFIFSGAAAVLYTYRYWGTSISQLLLGYAGAATFSTGIATTLLKIGVEAAVVLAAGMTASLTGFSLGVYLLLSGYVPWFRTRRNTADTDENTGNDVKCYGDSEIAEVKENADIPGDQ